jgi:S-adenosylmethionine:tRNA ribosyltransferase-isomerase
MTPGRLNAAYPLRYASENLTQHRAKKTVPVGYMFPHTSISLEEWFRPVSAETAEDHVMRREYYEMTETAAAQVNRALEEGSRVLAVGATSVRTLEACACACADEGRRVRAGSGWTDIFFVRAARFRSWTG